MELKKEIEIGFDDFVKHTFHNENIKNFLLKHERKELFQKNMLKQIKESYHVINDSRTIRFLIRDLTKMFCKHALEYKEKELNARNSASSLST